MALLNMRTKTPRRLFVWIAECEFGSRAGGFSLCSAKSLHPNIRTADVAGSFVLMNENGMSPKTPLLTPEELPSGRVLSVYCSGGLMTAGDVSPEDRGRS